VSVFRFFCCCYFLFSFLLFQSDAGSLKITGTIRTLSPLFSFHLSGHHILSSSSSSRSLLSSLFHSKPTASSFQLGNYPPSSLITGDNPDYGNHTVDITSFLRDGGQEHGMTAVSEIILYDQHHQAFKKTVESLDFLSFLSSSSSSERNCLLDQYHPDNKHSSSSSSSSNDNSNRNSRSSAGSVGGSDHTSNGMKDMPFLTFSNCKIIQNPSCFHNVSCDYCFFSFPCFLPFPVLVVN
jgi:hypothetical protein